MDRKGWIILILCGIGLMLTFNSMQESNKLRLQLAEKQKAENPESLQATGSDAEQTGNASGAGFTQNATQPDVVSEEETTYDLISKNTEGEVVKYTFTNFGGGIKEAHLLNEAEGLDGPVLLNEYGKHAIGSIALGEGKMAQYVYPDSAVEKTENSIKFILNHKSGLKIIKSWELASDDTNSSEYRLVLNISLQNMGKQSISLKDYAISTGIAAPLFEDERPDLCKWFFYQGGKYKSGSASPFKDGWLWGKAKAVDIHEVQNLEYAGVSNQFYTTIVVPSENSTGKSVWADDAMVRLDSAEEDLRSYFVGLNFPDQDLIEGAATSLKYDFYIGPRKQSDIFKLGSNTDEAMSYGWFAFAAPWANSALNWIHDIAAEKIYEPWSWGIAIVVLTILIRIIIWPLHNKSTRTMKRMSKLQPMMKEIREKHGDSPQVVQQETLKLYKKYKVNPMGGCLPMLVQMPIFFAVFGMLTNAVELRGEGFLWVKDLSQQENLFEIPFLGIPFNALPITMAGTMFLQMKMTPQSGDKMQRRIFMFLPIIFFLFCYSYASALALYWTVQNIVSIGQTWLMQRMPEPELEEVSEAPSSDGKPRKKGWMEKMAEKVEEAQKQRESAMSSKTGRPAPKPKAQPKLPGEKPAKDKKRGPKTGG